jgi:membrane protein YdbS with pleckstrin-like domain
VTPELPPEPDQRPAPAALLAWMLGGAGAAVMATVLAVVALGPRPLVVVAACLVAVGSVLVVPLLRYRTWRYAVREEEIDLRHGTFVVRRTIVPMVRVQHVDTSVTPLGQIFGITTLTVHTAAGKHSVPGLAAAVADRLRAQIAGAIREPDDV